MQIYLRKSDDVTAFKFLNTILFYLYKYFTMSKIKIVKEL